MVLPFSKGVLFVGQILSFKVDLFLKGGVQIKSETIIPRHYCVVAR